MNLRQQLVITSFTIFLSPRRTFTTSAVSTIKGLLKSREGCASGRMNSPINKASLRDHEDEDAIYAKAVNLLNTLQIGHRARNEGKKQNVTRKQRTEEWLRLLGHDIPNLSKPKVIHVAGTKGKGTTCYYCNHILCEYQKVTREPHKVGCYTSPHQIEVRERIQIDSQPISKILFTKYFSMLWNEIHALSDRVDLETPPIPGYPSFLTLLAIYHFILEKIDIAVIETGIGGEDDSTNIFRNPVATGITTIDFDHTRVLGTTIEEIARHKAGIFKEGCLAFTVPQKEDALAVLRKRANQVRIQGELEVITDKIVTHYDIVVDPNRLYQRLNASLAVALADSYIRSLRSGFAMAGTLARSVEGAVLPGRCQIKPDRQNTWFLSTAHNSISLVETISWFKEVMETSRYKSSPRVLIFGHESSRDSNSLLKTIHERLNADQPTSLQAVIFCPDQWDQTDKEIPDLIDLRKGSKAVNALQIERSHQETWRTLTGCTNTILASTVKRAIQTIRERFHGANVLVTGSHYLVGSVLYDFQRETES